MFKENKSSSSSKDRGFLDSFLAKSVLVLMSIFLIYNVFKSVENTVFKLNILEQAESEVDELRIKNIEYLLAKQIGETDEYIEIEARNRLNYSQEEEVVFIIPVNVLENADEEVDLILGKVIVDNLEFKEVWEIWYDFLVSGV